MIALLLAALVSAPPDCPVPDSMPPLIESMAGKGDPDWCLAGIDPFAVAGPDMRPPRQLVWDHSEVDTISIIQWRRSEPDAPPADWRRVFTRPETNEARGEFREILVQRIGDHVLVVTTNPAWRIGNAVCAGEGGTSIGYLPAGISPTDADQSAIEGMIGNPGEMDSGNIMCTLLTPDGDGWRGNFRGPQGRPLPEIEDFLSGVWMRAVPPGDFERHLRINR